MPAGENTETPNPSAEPIAPHDDTEIQEYACYSRALEKLLLVLPSPEFAEQYAALDVDTCFRCPSFLAEKSPQEQETVRALLLQRSAINEAVRDYVQAVMATKHPLSPQERASLRTVLQALSRVGLNNLINFETVYPLFENAAALFRDKNAIIRDIIRHGGIRMFGEDFARIIQRVLTELEEKNALSTEEVRACFTHILIEAEEDPLHQHNEGMEEIITRAIREKFSMGSALDLTIRAIQHETAHQLRRPSPRPWMTPLEQYLISYLRSPDKETRTCAWGAIEDWLATYNLPCDPGEISRAWAAGSPQPPHEEEQVIIGYTDREHEIYWKNIRRCIELETARPGSLRLLYEWFNMKDFGRYTATTLLQQIEERENVTAPYVLVIFPQDDWNGAFFGDDRLLEKLQADLHPQYLLRIIEGKGRDILQTIARLHTKRRYQLPSGLILGGHGSPEAIYFGETPLSKADMQRKRISRIFENKVAHIPTVLIACSTGQKGGIGQKISQKTKGPVGGPTQPAALDAITVKKPGEKGGPLELLPQYCSSDTGYYIKGVPLPAPSPFPTNDDTHSAEGTGE